LYNPFEKGIDDLTFDDIKTLEDREIKEGLFIEYKSGFTIPTKISHSVASFANTHGGWYFVGIDSDHTNIPTGFPGFSLTDFNKPLEHIRNIIKDHVDPFPKYYTKLIELEDERAILILEIPESDETPHITKDGRIYRRNAEGSDPVIETNRYVLDRLYEKSENFEKKIQHFCRRDIVVSEAEKYPWIELYLMPYPLNRLKIPDFYEMGFLKDLNEKINGQTKLEIPDLLSFSSSIPFNNVRASIGSIVFRQINVGSLPFMTLTFELFSNGNAKIVIPLQLIKREANLDTPVWKLLNSKLENEDFDLFLIIDGFKVFSIFITLLQKYFDILKSVGWQDDVLIAYKIDQIWRTILYLESKTMEEHINKYGIPICQRESAWIPSIVKKSNMLHDMPKDLMFQLTEYAKISSTFGTFPMEWGRFIAEWIVQLKKEYEERNV